MNEQSHSPDEPQATPADVAAYLAQLVNERTNLYYSDARQAIIKRFGQVFPRYGNSGELIDEKVLSEFRKYKDIVWVQPHKVWRKRREPDPPRRVVQHW